MTNPRQPKKLVEGAGTSRSRRAARPSGVPQTKANQTHSAFAWTNKSTGRVYVVLVDDLEELDVDILDITNPSKPTKVSETNLDQFAQLEEKRPHGDSVFSHDMVVKRINGRDIMLMSYWDGGYVTLDVTNPAAPKPLSDTDFKPADPARPARPGDHPGGQRPPGGVHGRRQVLLRDGRGLQPVPRPGHVRWRAGRRNRLHRHPGERHEGDHQGDAARGDTRFLQLACDPAAAPRRQACRSPSSSVACALPGQARQHHRRGLRGPRGVQPHRRGRLRHAGQHARLVGDDAGAVRVATGRIPPARRRAEPLRAATRARPTSTAAAARPRPGRLCRRRSQPSSTAGATRTCTRPTWPRTRRWWSVTSTPRRRARTRCSPRTSAT